MRLPIFQVDVFTDRLFGGNPAAVVPVDSWPDDALLCAIAAENNLSETAFVRRDGDGYELRWFTPKAEIDLCGHATLATAFVLANRLEPGRDRFVFETRRAGPLTVIRDGDLYVLDFPAWKPVPVEPHPALLPALGGAAPQAVLAARDYLVVYGSEAEVRALRPDFRALDAADRMVVVTAPGSDGIDFVLRFFAPHHGIDEDPVTGRAHCMAIPYWASRLGKDHLEARQVSARGGALTCGMAGDRVRIGGRAVLYLDGVILV